MKVLQLCNKAPYPANDGSSIAISNLAEGLVDNGVELFLLTINTKKHYKPDENVSVDFKLKTNYQSVYKDTNTSAFGAIANLFSKQSYFVSRFYFNEFIYILKKMLKAQVFDIIQLEGLFMASYIPIIKAYSHAKIILRSHNIEHQIWERHLLTEKNWIKKNYLTLQNKRLKAFEINVIQSVDAVVTITDEDKKNIEILFPNKKTYTCLTGINLKTYSFIHQVEHENTVFHFASMDWLPNIEAVDWLLENVWNEVLKKIPTAKLVLAGRGMPKRFLKLNSSSIKIIENVKDSQEFYHHYDIMLVPLWSGSGLRIKLVEGLAYGKPIITTSIGAEGIPYKKNADMVIADSAKEFSDALIHLLLVNEAKHKLSKSARLLAEAEFNYKILAENLLRFYHTLI